MENNLRAKSLDGLDSLELRLQSLDIKLTTLENNKKMLKDEADILQIKAELLRVKARSVELLSAEILKEGTEILIQIKYLAENAELGGLRQKLMLALEPLRKHFIDKQNI